MTFCDCIGHKACDCPSPVLCCICKEGDMGIDCTYSWFCSTVSQTDEQELSQCSLMKMMV